MSGTTFKDIGAEALQKQATVGVTSAEVAEAAGVTQEALEGLHEGRAIDAGALDRVGRALGTSSRRLISAEAPSALVAADPDLAATLRGGGRQGMPTEAERDRHSMVEALDDAAKVLALDARGASATHAVPHPERPDAPARGGGDGALASRTAGLMADAFLHGLVTEGKLRETLDLCLGPDAGGDGGYLSLCREAEGKIEGRRLDDATPVARDDVTKAPTRDLIIKLAEDAAPGMDDVGNRTVTLVGVSGDRDRPTVVRKTFDHDATVDETVGWTKLKAGERVRVVGNRSDDRFVAKGEPEVLKDALARDPRVTARDADEGRKRLLDALVPSRDHRFASLLVTEPEVAWLAGRRGTGAPVGRLSDLGSLRRCIAQPVWRDGTDTGDRRGGEDGARELLEGFGPGKYRRLRVELAAVLDASTAMGARGGGILARLADVQASRVEEVRWRTTSKAVVAGPDHGR